MKKLIALILVAIVAFWGCSKRDNPVDVEYSNGSLITDFINSESLDPNILGTVAGRSVYVYTPAGYTSGPSDSFEIYIDSTYDGGSVQYHFDTTLVVSYYPGAEYPVLYLLHGYGGSHTYFTGLFALESVLNEMIGSGEIVPMIVVTPDCSNAFGGSFYANSPELLVLDTLGNPVMVSFAGKFEDFMVNDLREFVAMRYNGDTTSAGTGISGHSMGGYGAIELAMKHPNLYGSVSVMSAPLAFSGFEALIPYVFAENGVTPGDTAGFYSIEPSADKTLTSMMFAMGAAFSPHSWSDPDTTYFHRILNVPYFVGIDLPFNPNGELITDGNPVWDAWLENDPLTTLIAGGGAAALMGKPLYIDCGSEDDFGFDQHLLGFQQALAGAGIENSGGVYEGFEGQEAGHADFVSNRLRAILVHHSDAFESAE